MTLLCKQEEETTGEALFKTSCVVDLSPLGSPEKRALLMGMLFMRLYERRLASGLPEKQGLCHLMVLEEAHVLLKRTSTEQGQETSNPRGLAVEAFANALAEMRAYGQGFIVADQSASALDDCVLRNTSIKIAMRAPFEEDRLALGGSLALDEEQMKQLARLENQTAVVHQSNWLEPVLCRITKRDIPPLGRQAGTTQNDVAKRTARTRLLLALLGNRLPPNVERPDLPEGLSCQEAARIAGLSDGHTEQMLEGCEHSGEHDLKVIAPLFPLLFPALADSAFVSMTLSQAARWNRVLALLEQETCLSGTEIALAAASDLLKSMEGADREAITRQHIERVDQWRF